MPKLCKGCGLKAPSYGLPGERRKRWCAGCAAAEGSGAVHLGKKKKCEGCGLKQPNFGLPGPSGGSGGVPAARLRRGGGR